MTLLQGFGTLFLALVAWRLLKRITQPRNPLEDVAGPEKEHWLKGNYHRIFQDGWDYNLQLAEKYGGAVKIHGLLGTLQLYVSDPRALHNIVVKEQHVFEETDMFILGNKIIFGEGLISTLGEQHRKQRKMLTPVFSLADMRDLLPVIQPIADKMRDVLLNQLPAGEGSQEIDLVPWMSRGTLEYVCQANLGYTFHALDPEKTNEYAKAVRNLSPTALSIILLRPFIPFFVRYFSLHWRNMFVEWLPIPQLRELRRIVRIMDTVSRQIFSEKRATMLGHTNGSSGTTSDGGGDLGERMRGKDIMSIMLKANASSDDADRLTDEELLGQVNTIIFAGFETTTIAVCRMLYILASKLEVQAKLRSEVRKAKRDYAASQNLDKRWEDVDLPYDVLMGLPFLDAVLRETLRVYPPTSLMSRTTRAATTLPLQFPVRSTSGAPITEISLSANTNVIISILASNHNKEVWGEDADEWRPERWLTATGERIRIGEDGDGVVRDGDVPAEGAPGNKGGVKYPGVYASMMTFLGGGRACIGFKFAEMEMKQILTTLLSAMHFALPAGTDAHGHRKEIRWKMNGLQVPVLEPPAGDGRTPQVPLDARRVCPTDFAPQPVAA
ncbi:cytochrome P450 [Obba rivulosa]|uniref:Cytochrome P450 n=1 Tax=Obba rivulosa TaxID=1052685 RepID=A0A8E2AYI4_9APHY|nr:cytochrome P450 [Obba rivulosa]